jgi:hypothetical protein
MAAVVVPSKLILPLHTLPRNRPSRKVHAHPSEIKAVACGCVLSAALNIRILYYRSRVSGGAARLEGASLFEQHCAVKDGGSNPPAPNAMLNRHAASIICVFYCQQNCQQRSNKGVVPE